MAGDSVVLRPAVNFCSYERKEISDRDVDIEI